VATARTWRRRFAGRGIAGLFDKPRPGRPEVHGSSARLAVLAVATSVRPEGESQWSQAMIAGHLRGRGLAISPATVGRVLEETSRLFGREVLRHCGNLGRNDRGEPLA
jgi:Homeodomain-like domain